MVVLFDKEKQMAKTWRINASYKEILSEEGWDESKHPRDKKGRFTYSESGTIKLPDEQLPRSLSAKWANYDIAMPDGTVAHFVEGTKLHHIEVFAGKGTKTPIRDVDRLVRKYGGKAEAWQKVKGIGTIAHNREEGTAEIHWYQSEEEGKQELKFKRYIDES